MEGQPISVEALECPVEENRPPPNPVEGAGTGPMTGFIKHLLTLDPSGSAW